MGSSSILSRIVAPVVEKPDIVSKKALVKLDEVIAIAFKMPQGREQAVYYRDEVMSAMAGLREPVDKLEMLVDKEMWPMPSYGDLIFEV